MEEGKGGGRKLREEMLGLCLTVSPRLHCSCLANGC